MARTQRRKDGQGPAKDSTTPTTSPTTLPASPATSPPVSLWRNINVQRALYLVVLAAIYAPLSQLVLTPVYGSIPSSLYHKYTLTGASLLAFTLRKKLPNWVDKALPAFAFWIPTIHFVMFKYSALLGNPIGPLVTELFTTFPLITLSMYLANKLLQEIDLSALDNDSLGEAGPPITFYFIFTLLQRLFSSVLPSWVGGNALTSRTGIQLAVASLYALLLPKSIFWPAIPSIGFTFIGNPHMPLQRTSDVLNNTLALYDYTLLERRESLTGYLSVLQDNKKGFRVMRCDHSLLGGEWQIPPPPGVNRLVGEPIYAVFTMLEAVRLIESPPSIPKVADKDARALNIGLGVGTAPSALIAHGISTTILEIDPVVHYLAGKYFNLPKNHTYYIGDAVDVVTSRAESIKSSSSSQEKSQSQYDYIIHDVFTGGALPVQLFTHTFLTSLSALLKPTGVIAINFAGDLNMPSASLIYRTISSVFPHCRIYREDPSPSSSPSSSSAEPPSDFTNLVYFCLSPAHPPSATGVKFRDPTESDFLGSGARKMYLLPTHEVDPRTRFETEGGVLDLRDRTSMKEVGKWQAKSAVGHWWLMRRVIRGEIWENW